MKLMTTPFVRPPRLRRPRFVWICALALAGACGEEPTTQDAPRRANAAAPDHTITLITGDRVTLVGGAPVIHPGAGRADTRFAIHRDGAHLIVLPLDVAPRVAAGELDRALFDVTQLLADGYGDARRDDLPLIITGAAARAQLAPASADVTVDRWMPALHAMAIRQRKTTTGAASLRTAHLAVAGPTKIWLDRVRQPVLDRSVPQIGGLAARARGFTGAGVTVAVLDTGVDSTHPDLAGQVIAAEDFTQDGGGALDVTGHGTHVASTIAGTGAASGGQLVGVAPDARLISGRVCEVFGCPDSAILAGIEWAVVAQHARIVNLSLGGSDTVELDPLEDAVNQMSAQYGALFVIAAGNLGEVGSIESPGSADAALTVGAVDRSDQLAAFSSRGPRIGDHAIKPDVTAPGVGIVAARATNVPPLGPPVGTSYVRLSGTSMAAPHVAGAAALLLQQHPAWTGAQLKAQLVATASPSPALVVFDQGSGRIDVERATRQAVSTDPASLSLGLASFPHDDDPLLVRTLTYHNAGTAPITLALTASLALPDHTAAPPGVISLAASSLVLPAGGSADVVVTVDTRRDAPDGSYGGTIVATAGDVRVETPVAVEREVESYDLTLSVVDTTGAPGLATVFLSRVPNELVAVGFVNATRTFRLPRGTYAVDALGVTFGTDPVFFVADPRFEVRRDAALVIDGRASAPVALTLPRADLVKVNESMGYVDTGTGHVFTVSGSDHRIGQLGPALPPDEVSGFVTQSFTPATDDHVAYHVGHRARGHLPHGWVETITDAQLATVHARYAGAPDHTASKLSLAYLDGGEVLHAAGGGGFELALPSQTTERFYAPGFAWLELLFDVPPVPGHHVAFSSATSLRDYQPGHTYHEQWNQAPFGPAFIPRLEEDLEASTVRRRPSATRVGDTLTIVPGLFTGQDRPLRDDDSFWSHQRIALSRDGELIAELIDDGDDALPPTEVPPGPATYRYEQSAVRPLAQFALSIRVDAAWTFRSRHAGAPRTLALPTVRFAPPLDPQHRTAARLLVMPVEIARPDGAPTPRIASARVEVSFDDGATWAQVPLARADAHGLALIVHRSGAAFVSLRATARDVEGNQVEQTIIRAYALGG